MCPLLPLRWRWGPLRGPSVFQKHLAPSCQRWPFLSLGEEEEEEGPDGSDGGGSPGAAFLLQPPQRGCFAQIDTQHPWDATEAHPHLLTHAFRGCVLHNHLDENIFTNMYHELRYRQSSNLWTPHLYNSGLLVIGAKNKYMARWVIEMSFWSPCAQ